MGLKQLKQLNYEVQLSEIVLILISFCVII